MKDANIISDYNQPVLTSTKGNLELFDSENNEHLLRRQLSLTVYVNKGNSNVVLYNDFDLSSGYVGQITPNEVYVIHGGEGDWESVIFVKSGVLTEGFLYYNTPRPSGFDTLLTAYPTGWWDTPTDMYYVFRLRRTANVLNYDGTSNTPLTTDKLVCAANSKVGEDNNGYKKIVGYLDSSFVLHTYPNGAFVDMGMTYGPFGSSMTMYGTF